MGFSEAVSYAVLLAISVYCLWCVTISVNSLDLLAYSATGLTAVFALIENVTESSEGTIDNLKGWAEFFESFTFPCLVGCLYLQYGEELYIAYAFPALMLLLKLVGSDALGHDPSVMMAIGYAVNQLACLYISYEKENMCSMAAAVVFFLTELILIFKEDVPLPITESVNYGLAATILLFSLAIQSI